VNGTTLELEHDHSRASISARLSRQSEPGYLHDLIYGGIDGAVTTFAVVAGVVGAHLSPGVILVIGLASLIADGFAMAAGNYSATKADRDDYARLLAIERKHIALIPEGEREEIRQIYAAKGFAGAELERVVAVLTADPESWARTMAAEEYGLAPVPKSPLKAAINTLSAFWLCGMVPLGSYLASDSLPGCVAATGVTFLAIGAIKSRWSLSSWWRSGLETLAVGMSAALLAFAVGYGLRSLTH
jgi:VIT1/CCC1 family predicted Fe2+/Mn2+ transporter